VKFKTLPPSSSTKERIKGGYKNKATMQEVTIITYVLDDDREDLLLIDLQLKQIPGCHYSLHHSVEEFITAIEQGAHIAIIDYQLNGSVDGVEVGRMVLQKNKLCFLIMLSGSDDKRSVIRAMNAGFSYYIDKNDPLYLRGIGQVVEQQLSLIKMRIGIEEKYKKQLFL
jgi:FixJ family two-component response regulator